MAQSSKEKSALYAKRQKDMDRLGRKVWATIHEHDKIQLLLSQLRGEAKAFAEAHDSKS